LCPVMRDVTPPALNCASLKLPSTVVAFASCIARSWCEPPHSSYSLAWHGAQARAPTYSMAVGLGETAPGLETAARSRPKASNVERRWVTACRHYAVHRYYRQVREGQRLLGPPAGSPTLVTDCKRTRRVAGWCRHMRSRLGAGRRAPAPRGPCRYSGRRLSQPR